MVYNRNKTGITGCFADSAKSFIVLDLLFTVLFNVADVDQTPDL